MTGGQTALSLESQGPSAASAGPAGSQRNDGRDDLNLVVVRATEEELAAHEAMVEKIRQNV